MRPSTRQVSFFYLLLLVALAGCRSGKVAFQFQPSPTHSSLTAQPPRGGISVAAEMLTKPEPARGGTQLPYSSVAPLGLTKLRQGANLPICRPAGAFAASSKNAACSLSLRRHHHTPRILTHKPADSLHGLGVLIFLIGLGLLVLVTLIMWVAVSGVAALITGIVGALLLVQLAQELELL